jgi:hypothetical protein
MRDIHGKTNSNSLNPKNSQALQCLHHKIGIENIVIVASLAWNLFCAQYE